MKHVTIFGLMLVMAVQPAIGQPVPATATAASPEALFTSINASTPGLVVLVAKGHKLLFQRAAGSADLEQGVPLTAGTKFHLASVSKQFTAAAVLLLARDGKLRLDAPVRTYLPELPHAYATITVAQLLNHTSGLRDQWDLVSASGASMSDLLQQDRLFALVKAQRGLNFTPGSEFRYSNSGYMLAAETVARVSGMPFASFVEQRLFRPLGMANSVIYTDPAVVLPGRAQSYSASPPYRNARLNYSNHGATSMFSTAGDLLLWSRELLHPRVLDASIVAMMARPTTLNDGTLSNYGFGLYGGKVRGSDAILHGGADAGFRTLLAVHPVEDVSIIILSNGSADTGSLHEALVGALVTGQPGSGEVPPPATATLPSMAGYYVSGWGPGFTLTVNGSTLERQIAAGPAQAARYFDDGTIRFTAPNARFKPAGAGVLHQISGNDPPVVFRRVEKATPSAAGLAALAGQYRSGELDQTVTIAVAGDRLQMSSMRQPEPRLLTAADHNHFDFASGRLKFQQDSAGRVVGFTLQLSRTRNVEFQRLP